MSGSFEATDASAEVSALGRIKQGHHKGQWAQPLCTSDGAKLTPAGCAGRIQPREIRWHRSQTDYARRRTE